MRRLARELGVELTASTGSGRKGRIVAEDVRAVADGDGPGGGRGGRRVRRRRRPRPPALAEGRLRQVRRGRARASCRRSGKISAANLSRNWVRIPHVTHHDEADITDLEAFRKQLNAEQSDVKVTMVALLLKAVVASLKAFPDVNASLDGDDAGPQEATTTSASRPTRPTGSSCRSSRTSTRRACCEVAGELTELSGKARAGKLGPAEMAGATFTISSLGGIGGTSFTPIVNAPEVAILGVVRSAMKPVWDGKEFVPRLMLPLSLSYDHRVIDGAAAARFVAHLSGVLTDLRRVLL